jgi:hypothetical protein
MAACSEEKQEFKKQCLSESLIETAGPVSCLFKKLRGRILYEIIMLPTRTGSSEMGEEFSP